MCARERTGDVREEVKYMHKHIQIWSITIYTINFDKLLASKNIMMTNILHIFNSLYIFGNKNGRPDATSSHAYNAVL